MGGCYSRVIALESKGNPVHEMLDGWRNGGSVRGRTRGADPVRSEDLILTNEPRLIEAMVRCALSLESLKY